MGKLIKAEFIKLSKSLGYKVLLLCSAAMGILVETMFIVYDAADMIESMDIKGSDIYFSILSQSQFYMILAAIFAGLFICKEFSDRTFAAGVSGGCTRLSLMLAKAVVFTVGLLSIFFTCPLVSSAIVTFARGFGELNAELLSLLGWATFRFIIGGAAIGGFCFMLAMLIKSVGGAIGACLGTLLMLSIISQFPQFQPVMKFSFTYQFTYVAQPDFHAMYFVVILATIVITMTASKIIFEKSELK